MMDMTVDNGEDMQALYGNFGFHVQFGPNFAPYDGLSPTMLGSFSEISGIEASMEHKVIKEGGRNYGTAMRAGSVTFGTVILKRGIVKSQTLWRWWSMFTGADDAAGAARPVSANRCDILIGLIEPVRKQDSDGKTARKALDAFGRDADTARSIAIGWRLVNAMPVKFRVGDLNAKGSDVAVEEIHLVHEGLQMQGVS